jgi:Skp family chaperone for outer membrane proteins
MNFLKYFFIFSFLLISNHVSANTNVVFVDIDFLIQKSNLGKKVLKKIETNNLEKKEFLKNEESKLRIKDSEIKKKKNIISNDQYQKEIDLLKKNITTFNDKKKTTINEFNKFKADELNKILEKFNKIIKLYMEEKSIQIVLNQKNLYMGISSSDITKDILVLINNQYK